MIAFARVTGPLLLLAFGAQGLAFSLRDQLISDIETRMQREGEYSFATLDRAQQRQSFSGNGKRYFYAYSGRYRNISYERTKEVSAQYYHLNSEGKNVEVLVYLDPAGNLHTHLRGNTHPFSARFEGLRKFSFTLALGGLILSVLGFGGRLWQKARRSPEQIDPQDA